MTAPVIYAQEILAAIVRMNINVVVMVRTNGQRANKLTTCTTGKKKNFKYKKHS